MTRSAETTPRIDHDPVLFLVFASIFLLSIESYSRFFHGPGGYNVTLSPLECTTSMVSWVRYVRAALSSSCHRRSATPIQGTPTERQKTENGKQEARPATPDVRVLLPRETQRHVTNRVGKFPNGSSCLLEVLDWPWPILLSEVRPIQFSYRSSSSPKPHQNIHSYPSSECRNNNQH